MHLLCNNLGWQSHFECYMNWILHESVILIKFVKSFYAYELDVPMLTYQCDKCKQEVLPGAQVLLMIDKPPGMGVQILGKGMMHKCLKGW